MKKALVDSEVVIANGYRVCQVVNTIDDIFPVDETSGLSWIECPDNVIADEWYYNVTDNTFTLTPMIFVGELININGFNGEEKTIKVTASVNNNYTLNYEWLESNDDGSTFNTIPNETFDTYTFILTPDFNNKQLYCKVITDHDVFAKTNIILVGVL